MGWLFGIIFLIIFIILLVKFPKLILLISFSFIVLCVVLWFIFVKIPDDNRKAMNNSIAVSVSYNLSFCNSAYPLFATIKNNSSKTITRVYWDLNIYIPGYSTDISGYDNHYSSDKILKPGEGWKSCYKLPSTLKATDHGFDSLEYKVSGKYVQCQE
jgi:hypothetical protein